MSYSSPDFTKESNSYIMSQYEQNAIAAAEAATARLAGATGGGKWIPDKPQPESPLHNLSRMHQAMLSAIDSESKAAIIGVSEENASSPAISFATDFSDYAKVLGEIMDRALVEYTELRERHIQIEKTLGIMLEKPGVSLPALQADLDQKIILKQTEEERKHYAKVALGLGACL
jgi:hypothetical protein